MNVLGCGQGRRPPPAVARRLAEDGSSLTRGGSRPLIASAAGQQEMPRVCQPSRSGGARRMRCSGHARGTWSRRSVRRVRSGDAERARVWPRLRRRRASHALLRALRGKLSARSKPRCGWQRRTRFHRRVLGCVALARTRPLSGRGIGLNKKCAVFGGKRGAAARRLWQGGRERTSR